MTNDMENDHAAAEEEEDEIFEELVILCYNSSIVNLRIARGFYSSFTQERYYY
jgi:hypothetical protein